MYDDSVELGKVNRVELVDEECWIEEAEYV